MMLDKRRRMLQMGDTVLWRTKRENGRVAWRQGQVITTGNKYVHVLSGDQRLRLLPTDVERIR